MRRAEKSKTSLHSGEKIMSRPVITDCEGLSLTEDEKNLFREHEPFGFILFGRNCDTPDQIKALTDEMRDCVGRDVPIMIDQEGGRVCRLAPPHWRKIPPADVFGDLYKGDPEKALQAIILNTRLMADDLVQLGITMDCFPVLDLFFAGASDIIGDRSYGADIDVVTALGGAAAEAMMMGGIIPIVKHIPGHGRALVDSHAELPTVKESHDELLASDFMPFKNLAHLPCAMTAHIVYSDIDPKLPATLSPTLIRQVIRGDIGFKGVLISDDITMKALSGAPEDIAKTALRAGCDLVLHCNATLEERRSVLESLYDFNPANINWVRSELTRRRPAEQIDRADFVAELNKLIG